MKSSKKRFGLLASIMIIAGMLCLVSPMQAAAITQGEYAVLLAAKLGLGEGLTAEKAATALEGVGIIPKAGWQLKRDVTCELVDEVQILTIKAAQKKLLKNYAPEDIPPLMAALSDKCGACVPTVVVYSPSGGGTPPPIFAPGATGGGGGRGTASPSIK